MSETRECVRSTRACAHSCFVVQVLYALVVWVTHLLRVRALSEVASKSDAFFAPDAFPKVT